MDGIALLTWFFGIMILSFLFPLYDLRVTGPEEGKNLAGERPQPDSDPFSSAELGKISATGL